MYAQWMDRLFTSSIPPDNTQYSVLATMRIAQLVLNIQRTNLICAPRQLNYRFELLYNKYEGTFTLGLLSWMSARFVHGALSPCLNYSPYMGRAPSRFRRICILWFMIHSTYYEDFSISYLILIMRVIGLLLRILHFVIDLVFFKVATKRYYRQRKLWTSVSDSFIVVFTTIGPREREILFSSSLNT